MLNNSLFIQNILDSLRAPIESYRLVDAVYVKPHETVLDLGCGNGFVLISILSQYPNGLWGCGVDVVHGKLREAKKAESNIRERMDLDFPDVDWICGDVRSGLFKPRQFDVIVSNPPFFDARCSRPSPKADQTIAHSDAMLNLPELFACVVGLLKPEGRFYMVYPLARLKEIEQECLNAGMKIMEQRDHLEVRKRSGGVTVVRFEFI